MKKIFAAFSFVFVLLLAITAEAWVSTLGGWLLALAGLAAVGICGRIARCC